MDPIVQRPKALTKILVQDPTDSASVADALHRMQDQLLAQLNPTLRNPVVASSGTASPLTTKGDLYGRSTVDARLPVGTDGLVLTADSTQALGMKWGAVAAGGGWSLATKPAVANADDDEFDLDTLTSGPWVMNAGYAKALVNPITNYYAPAVGTLAYNIGGNRPGWLMGQVYADSAIHYIRKPLSSLPVAGDFFYVRATSTNGQSITSAATLSLQIYDGTHYVEVLVNPNGFTGTIRADTSGGASSAGITSIGASGAYSLSYLGIYMVSNTSAQVYCAGADNHWEEVFTPFAVGAFAGTCNVYLGFNNAAVGKTIAGYDFFRRRSGGVLP